MRWPPIPTGSKVRSPSRSSNRVTDWLSVSIRAALYADLMLLFGWPLFGLYSFARAERPAVWPLRAAMAVVAALGLALSALGIAIITAGMAGVPLSGIDRSTLDMVITETSIGTAWQVRMGALAVVLVCTLNARRRSAAPLLATAAAAVALASLAWTGHGAASEGRAGLVHLWADIAHLLAAGAWLGAIAAFGWLLLRPAASMTPDHLRLTHRALARFSVIGSLLVGVLIASGLVNGYMLIGPMHVLDLPATLYGQLFLVKLALFAAMLALAAGNRFRLTPALSAALAQNDPARAVMALRRSIALEASAALIILGLVAWIGTLSPPMADMG